MEIMYGLIGVIVSGVILACIIRYAMTKKRDWRAYEMRVAEQMRANGFVLSKLPSKGSDGGVDVKGWKDGKLYIVQAKYYTRSTVGITIVKELIGTCALEKAKPVLAITKITKVSKYAQRYIKAMGIEVWRL